MKTTLLFLAAVGLASAGVIPVAPIVGHVATQYHAQDELGQYSYGYAGGPSAKDEIKTADGITRGGYTYIDGNGLVQSAAYVSDPVNGFRVAATNLPAGPAVPAGPQVVAVEPTISIAPATVGVSQAAPALPVDAAVLAKQGDQQPSTIILSAVSPVTIQQEAPAPVEEKNEESPEAPKSEAPQENSGASADAIAVATIEQLVTPVQDTPEVQAAKAAHLAAVEAVKVRDAAQAEQDAQENNISKSDEENETEKPDESGESGDESKSTESTEAPAAAPSPAAEPAPAPAPEPAPAADAPVAPKVEVTPSIVATELAPAAPLPSSSFVPSVLVKEVVAAQAIPVPQVSLVAAPVAESVAVPAAAPVAVPVAAAPVAVPVAAAPVAVPVAAAPVAVPAAAPVAVPGVVIGAPIAPSPSGPVALEHVGQITSQYHAQDELGQYAYGYSGGPSAKHELKTADGLTSGGYSYIDSHGLVQTAAYLSDPVNGFRVAATNIPQPRQPEYIADSPEVEEAKQQLFKAQAEHIAKL